MFENLLTLTSGQFLAFDFFLVITTLLYCKIILEKEYYGDGYLFGLFVTFILSSAQIIFCTGWIEVFSNSGQFQVLGLALGILTLAVVLVAQLLTILGIAFCSDQPETT